MLYQILRNRLKQRTNNRFVSWRFINKKSMSNSLHHWLESRMGSRKLNDYMLVEIPEELHKQLHYSMNKAELKENNEINFLIESLENIFDYLEGMEAEVENYKQLLKEK